MLVRLARAPGEARDIIGILGVGVRGVPGVLGVGWGVGVRCSLLPSSGSDSWVLGLGFRGERKKVVRGVDDV